MKDLVMDIKTSKERLNASSIMVDERKPKFTPKLYRGNNTVHSVQVITYDRLGEIVSSMYISGNILSEYKYNTRTNTFTPLPKVTVDAVSRRSLEGYNEDANNPSYHSYEYQVPSF